MNHNPLIKIHMFILCVVIASFVTSCSGPEVGTTYQYQVPAKLDDGWETASLKEAGHEVMLLDCLLKGIGSEEFRDILSKEKPDFADEIEDIFDYKYHIKNVDRIFRQVGI